MVSRGFHGRRNAVILALACWMGVTLHTGDALDIDWEGDAQQVLRRALKVDPNWGVAKNVILFVGDGMGISTVTTSRIYGGQKEGKLGEDHVLAVDKFPYVALSKTYDASNQVPDSSATATAMMCGAKSPRGTVGLTQYTERGKCNQNNNSKKPRTQTSILDWSLDKGKSVGMVTTTRITHATPASAFAHVEDRDWEADSNISPEVRESCGDVEDIASQLVARNPKIKVILGGGRRNFFNSTVPDIEYGDESPGKRADGRDLVQEWIAEKNERQVSHSFVWNATEFEKVDSDKTEYVLGLFEPSHMQYELDRPSDKAGEPSLTEMTEKAINILSKHDDDKGYFLLIEGGRIDHAHHENNAKRAMEDTVEFMSAIQKAVDMTSEKDTLMVVTADHSHVLTMGGYSLRGNPILGTIDAAGTEEAPAFDNATYLTLMYANGPGPTRRLNLTKHDTEADDFHQTVSVQIKSETHAGEDVAIYARGPMAHLFQGTVEQNYIAHVLGYASCVGRNQEHCDTGARQTVCPPANDDPACPPPNSAGRLGLQTSSFLCAIIVCLCLLVLYM